MRGEEALAGAFSLVPRGQRAKFLQASEDVLPWFDNVVTKIYEVSHGIFYGELGGDRLPAWAPGAFREALFKLRQEAKDICWPDAGTLHEPADDVALASRLIATDLDVKAAAQLLRDYMLHRQSPRGGVAPTLEWLHCGIVSVPCEDFLGRPVINVCPRHHKPGDLELFRLGLRTTLDCVKAHLLHKRTNGFSQTNPLEQYTMIWDFEGTGWSNLDWEAFHCTIFEGAHHYPNMGSQIYVLNVNSAVRWVWNTASRCLHPKIRRKCCLVAPTQVNECLQKLIPIEALPPKYGGSGPDWPAPADATTFEDQVGELAARVYRRAGVVPAGAKPLRSAMPKVDPDWEDTNEALHIRVKGRNLGCCFGFA